MEGLARTETKGRKEEVRTHCEQCDDDKIETPEPLPKMQRKQSGRSPRQMNWRTSRQGPARTEEDDDEQGRWPSRLLCDRDVAMLVREAVQR